MAAVTSLPLILCVALGTRVAFAWNEARQIPANYVGVVPFLNENGNVAQALVHGKGFSDVFRRPTGPTAWLTPVYPLLTAGIFKFFGVFTAHAFFAAVGMNIIFSAAACVPIFQIGKKLSGVAVASGAAWLWAVFPDAFILPYEWIWDTALSALLAAIILRSTLLLAESERWRDWSWYGLLWGFTLMTNPSLGSLLPFLLGWAAYRHHRQYGRIGRGVLRNLSASLIMVVLCCLPWTIRNYVDFHEFVPLRSNFPFELWMGNSEVWNQDSHNMMARVTRYGELRRYMELGEPAFMHEKWVLATQFMRDHPSQELRLCARRFVATWIGLDFPIRGFFESDSLLVKLVLLSNLFVAIGTVAGIVVLLRRRSEYAFPLAIVPAIYPCIYYVTHAELRYRHPIDPLLLLLTAIAAESLILWLARGVAAHVPSPVKQTLDPRDFRT